MSKPVFPWSHSALESYDTCPWRYYRQRIEGDVVEEAGEAALYGSQVHKALEEAVRDGTPLPPEHEGYINIVTAFARVDPQRVKLDCETRLAVREDGSGCRYDDPDAFSRGIIDVLMVNDASRRALVVDYKTGKFKPETPQSVRNAYLVFGNYADVDRVITLFVYTKTGQMVRTDYTRDTINARMAATFETVERLRVSDATGEWPKKRSGLCFRYCPVLDCEHNGRGR